MGPPDVGPVQLTSLLMSICQYCLDSSYNQKADLVWVNSSNTWPFKSKKNIGFYVHTKPEHGTAINYVFNAIIDIPQLCVRKETRNAYRGVKVG